MTHPTLFQVKNIVEMFEKDIIPLKALVLLGIYHEDELANDEEAQAYQEAFDYVQKNGHSLGAVPQNHRPGREPRTCSAKISGPRNSRRSSPWPAASFSPAAWISRR